MCLTTSAVIIALSGPERLSQIARAAEAVEMEEVAKREPIATPWGNFDSFRADVMKEWKNGRVDLDGRTLKYDRIGLTLAHIHNPV